MSLHEKLDIAAPLYVTRETADGQIGTWTVNAWVGVAVLLLVLANILLWGVVGLVKGIEVLF